MSDLARFRSRLLAASFALTAILICGCGVPLAPGYQIKKEALTVHFVSSDSPHLAVHIEYTLANTGNAPLHFIDIALPSTTGFGSANFRAQINGRDIALPPPSIANSQTRIPLSSDWRRKGKIALALSYDLAATPAADPRILIASKMFLLNDSGWFPVLLPFKAFLAPQVTRPNRTDLSVLVPSDFRATASGQPRGAKKQDGELEYRFRIGKSDFNPYVLAGQYNEQRVSTSAGAVVLWTFAPIPSAQAQQTASQISNAASFFSRNFGALPKSIHAIYEIEIPGGTSSSLRNGTPFSPPATTIDSSSYGAAEQLANTWFSHVIRPRTDSWLLALAFSSDAAAQWAETSGTSRPNRIASILADYHRLNIQVVESPVLSMRPGDPAIQQQLAAVKMQLFLFALEDKCGQQNVAHAIAHMVYALRGQEYGYPEFRSALEQQCHQNLAEFFRTWLAQPGIPSDFRARYDDAAGSVHSSSQ